jgi:hypothetical protein
MFAVTTAAVLLSGDAVADVLEACGAYGARAAHPTTPIVSINAQAIARLGRAAMLARHSVKASPLGFFTE